MSHQTSEQCISGKALKSYLSVIHRWVPDEPVVHIDDSDIVKPDGHKFEALGLVRDGSESTDAKNVYEKGVHVTFYAMERSASLFGKATFVMDRGHPALAGSMILRPFWLFLSSFMKKFTRMNANLVSGWTGQPL